MTKSSVNQSEKSLITFSKFLESTPPSTMTGISDLAEPKLNYKNNYSHHQLCNPVIRLHCENGKCDKILNFRRTSYNVDLNIDKLTHFILEYTCSNCQSFTKTYSLTAKSDAGSFSGNCYKFGELPVFGPPTSSSLLKLIRPNKELFLKGRRCENKGLGIGAFVYYRRVVENQKDQIIDEIIKASKMLSVDSAIIDKLESAKKETRFSSAIEKIKDIIPESLHINGQNPLTLLHKSLSKGVHDLSDEECLRIARSIRVVLGKLSENISQILKDEDEVKKAVSVLLGAKNE